MTLMELMSGMSCDSSGPQSQGSGFVTGYRHALPDIRWLQHSVLDDLLTLEQVLGSARHAR